MKRFIYCSLALILVTIMCFSCTKDEDPVDENPPYVQVPKGTTDTTLTILSSILDRTVHYSVYLPPGYDNSAAEYPVLYLLHGMYGNHRDWVEHGMATIMNYAFNDGSAIPMVVIMPQGYNAFYCNNYNNEGLMYEDFMTDEFFPNIKDHYRIKTTRNNTAIAGLSMGGYGCTYLAFKHREMFGSVYAMSAAVPTVTGAPDLRDLINGMTGGELDSLPPYTMEVGTEDFLVFTGNETFHTFLNDKGITHSYITRPGTHDWDFWMTCLPKAVKFVSKTFDDTL